MKAYPSISPESRTNVEQLKSNCHGPEIANRLGLIRKGSRWWCPNCQNDGQPHKTPDLAVYTGDGGQWFHKCHRCQVGGDLLNLIELVRGCDFPAAVDWLEQEVGNGRITARAPEPKKPKPRFPTLDQCIDNTATYRRDVLEDPYHNPADRYYYTETFWTVRFLDDRGDKIVLPFWNDGTGWAWEFHPSPRPLYNLDKIDGSELLLIVEGEKCANAAAALGFAAITSSGGCGSAKQSDWTPVSGKRAVISPDADERGPKYVADVRALLKKLSPAPTVEEIELFPGCDGGQDIADFIEQRDSAEASAIKGQIEQLISAAGIAELSKSLQIITASSVDPKPVDFLWPRRIPLGMLSLIFGLPAEGKSFVACDLAARVSCGMPWPDNLNCDAPRGHVLMLAHEDSKEYTLVPRLTWAGADLDKIGFIECAIRNGEEEFFTLDQHRDRLELALAKMKPKLLIIDPLDAYLGEKNSHHSSDIRGLLAPLASLAERYGTAILLIDHVRKSGASSSLLRLGGSIAKSATVRAAWMAQRHPQDTTGSRRTLTESKYNIGRAGHGLGFSIAGVEHPISADAAAISWESAPIFATATELMVEIDEADQARHGGRQQDKARQFLQEKLADGPIASEELYEAAQAQDIARRTLWRAADSLSVIRTKIDFTSGWQWELPNRSNEACQN